MPMLDIFKQDAFNLRSLTASIDKLPYVPGRVGKLNLFTNKPATDDIAHVEERYGKLSLLPTAQRGQTGTATQQSRVRKMRPFNIPHVPQSRAVLAASLEGKRAFGSETELEVFASVVNDELASMKQDHSLTWEYHMLGALKGIVLDADGSTEIVNFFTEFGISQTEIDFNRYDSGGYDTAAPAQRVRTLAATIKRAIRDALGGTPFTGIHALCGDDYFDRLVEHATVRGAYKGWTAAEILAKSQIDEGDVFPFAGIDWENYRSWTGDIDFIATDEAVIFPTGASDVFMDFSAPAQWIETVNTRGLPLYAKQRVMDWDEGIELRTESNRLFMCNRPAALIKSSLVNEAPGTGS